MNSDPIFLILSLLWNTRKPRQE